MPGTRVKVRLRPHDESHLDRSSHAAHSNLGKVARNTVANWIGYAANLLVVILQHLELQLRKLRSGDSQLQRRWQERCLLTGQTIHVDTPSRQLVGVCRGIDDHGALLLEIGASVERCLAGVVTRIY